MAQGGVKHVVTVIVWTDAAGAVCQGWRPVHEAIAGSGVVHCVSSGHVIKETRKAVTLAAHCVFDGGEVSQVDGEISIPKGWIVSRKTIEATVPGEGEGK